VRLEGCVGFFDNGRREAIVANHDNGVEVVRFGSVNLALGGSQLNLRHGALSLLERKNMKVKTKSKKFSKSWLNDHVNDPVRQVGQKRGLQGKGCLQIEEEIDETFGLIKPGNLVVDLGSAPGAWSQYVRRILAPRSSAGALNGTILAVDLLPMEPVEGVHFIQGDFTEADVLAQFRPIVGDRPVDVVVSDMAPNLSGIDSVDAARISHLIELAVEFAQMHLKPQGALVVKVFHGSGY
jgi:23S rRNA (uridine2552-2'-O)-methyltransferase